MRQSSSLSIWAHPQRPWFVQLWNSNPDRLYIIHAGIHQLAHHFTIHYIEFSALHDPDCFCSHISLRCHLSIHTMCVTRAAFPTNKSVFGLSSHHRLSVKLNRIESTINPIDLWIVDSNTKLACHDVPEWTAFFRCTAVYRKKLPHPNPGELHPAIRHHQPCTRMSR